MNYLNGGLDIFAALVIIMLLGSVNEQKHTPLYEKFLLSSLMVQLIVLIFDAVRWLVINADHPLIIIRLFLIVTYLLSLVGNALFVLFIKEYLFESHVDIGKMVPKVIVFFIISAVTWVAFVFLGGAEYCKTGSISEVQPIAQAMYYTSQFSWGMVAIIGLFFIFKNKNGMMKHELSFLIIYCLAPMFAAMLKIFWNGTQVYLATTLSLVLIHSIIRRDQNQRILEKEAQLAQSRISILLSQIQPHFLYNTLTAICGLCDINPKEAKTVTAQFADYLRHNLESLTHRESIHFEKELEHTKVYLEIEKKRFGEKLKIKYDINVKNFNIPSLTLQPIVENAVKHGIRGSIKGGTITISTTETIEGFEIVVLDNGVGFNMDKLEHNDEKHIGIENVRNRLWAMSKGTIEMESKIGLGTKIIIKIPKGEKN